MNARKQALSFAMAAGTLISANALAQVNDNVDGRIVTRWGSEHLVNRHGYDSRVLATVYSTGLATETGGGFAGPAAAAATGFVQIYDDVAFTPGPGAGQAITVTGTAFGVWNPPGSTTASAPEAQITVRFTVYPTHTEGATPPYSGAALGTFSVTVGGPFTLGQGFFFENPVAIDAGTPFTIPANSHVGVLAEVVNATGTPIPGYDVISRANHSWGAGSSDGYRWFSAESATYPPPTMGPTNRTPAAGTAVIPTNDRSMYLKLQANATPVAPTINHAFGCIPDGVTTFADTIPANGHKFYTVCLNNNATDTQGVNGTFVDMDTEGSVPGTSIAVFDSTGAFIARDDGSGSGSNSNLSFGVGRRAAVGDGNQYDGRNSSGANNATRGLVAGTYYVAVANAGSGFGDGWTVNDGAGAGGAVTFNLKTNNNGAALAPSVAPIPLVDGGVLTVPGMQMPSVATGSYQINWYKFNTCRDADGTNTVQIDMTGSNAPSTAMNLFNSSGNLIATSVSATPGVNPTPLTFNTPGSLAAGDYYVAFSYNGNQTATLATTDGRWHLRGTRGDNGFGLAGEVLVSWTDCGSNACCRNDYNGDGDVGTDLDIENFFSCLGGTCCATCPPNADFNCDGDVGTDSDIEAFFRVLGGGAC